MKINLSYCYTIMKKSILQKILIVLARAALKKYKPKIIGVTGSVGKTSAREAIFAVLNKKFNVRRAEKNYNTEIGLPLAILGIKHHGRNIFAWFSALVSVAMGIYVQKRSYPEILILEYGIDHPGDMEILLSVVKPDIAVVTAIGDVPVHVEFFEKPEDVVKEKKKLVEALSPEGHAVLNHDDYAAYDMKEATKAKVMTFGFEEHADMKISNFQFLMLKNEEFGDMPSGISFKLRHLGHEVPVRLLRTFGQPQAYAAAAAVAVGTILGMNLVEISEAIKDYIPPAGRLRLLKGIKQSLILDDTYNAAPEAMRSALDTLEALPGKRKIAVLGDMLEIGTYAEQVHRTVGDKAAKFTDLLLTVGPRAKFIADEALRRLDPPHIMKFDEAREAGKALDPLIRPGDLILVKGSQSMRMEKAVEEIMAEPDKAGGLLARQDEYWKNQ